MTTAVPLLLNPKYFILSLFIIAAIIISIKIRNITINDGYIKGRYKVVKTTSMGPIINVDNVLIWVKTKTKYSIGDLIYVKGKSEQIVNYSTFNQEGYFKALGTKSYIRFPTLALLEKTNDIRVKISDYISSGPDEYRKVTPLLLLGIKNINSKPIYDLSIKMNIVHLFVISGFHISLFFILFKKIISFLKPIRNIASWISLTPIVVYIFILHFPISATRAAILVILSTINKEIFKGKFNSMTVFALTLGMMFVYNPYSVYSLSFQFTFIATFSVLFINGIEIKSDFKKYILITVCVYFSNMPLITYQNHFVSLFGAIYGVILTPIFVFLYSVSLILFPFKSILNFIDLIFIDILKIINQTNLLINVPRFSNLYIELTYGLVVTSIIILLVWNFIMEKKVF